ncbi:MAG: glycosyltransferase family 4 protein [Ilyomonas sp.]
MRVAFILPSLANKGPIIVARDIVNELAKKDAIECTVFYFDDIKELTFACPVKQISFTSKINSKEFDIIHSHMLRPDLFAAFRLKRSKKTRLISTVHSYIDEDLKNSYGPIVSFFTKYIWYFALNRLDKVVCLSKDMINYYKNRIRNNRLTYVYNGRTTLNNISNKITSHVEETSIIEQLKSKYTVIGGIGNITKIKGFEQLIKVLSVNPRYAVIIIGDGPEKESLIRLAKENKVDERCIFLGYKSNATDYYHYFDVFAITSYSEGFSLVLIEAAAYNLPVVCSDINIFRELFNSSEVCFYTLYNIKDLSQALDKAIKNRGELSKNIHKRYIEKYTAEKMAENYLELYQSLV